MLTIITNRKMPYVAGSQIIVTDDLREGLQWVWGDSLIFINGDDWYAPNYIELLTSNLYSNDLAGVSHDIEYDHRRRVFRRCHNEEPMIWGTAAKDCAIEWLKTAEEPWRIWEFFHGYNGTIPNLPPAGERHPRKHALHIRQRDIVGNASTDHSRALWREWTKKIPS